MKAKGKKKRKRDESKTYTFVDADSIREFANVKSVTLEWLKHEAKRLQLVQTVSGRYSSFDRCVKKHKSHYFLM